MAKDSTMSRGWLGQALALDRVGREREAIARYRRALARDGAGLVEQDVYTAVYRGVLARKYHAVCGRSPAFGAAR